MGIKSILPSLSDGILNSFSFLPNEILKQITEIRIRKNLPLILVFGKNCLFITGRGKLLNHYSEQCYIVNDEEFDLIFRKLSNYSVHSVIDNLTKGFITADGGNRIGVSSTAVIKDKEITAVKEINSLNIRIANEIKDCSRQILNLLYINSFPSIIVASAPSGAYKGANGINADLGMNTDVLTGYPKSEGIEMAIRTLSPEMIVCDEISKSSEVAAMADGFLSGVRFAVSVHASSREEIMNKKIVRELIARNEFDYIVLLNDYTSDFEIMEVSEIRSEIFRNYSSEFILDCSRL